MPNRKPMHLAREAYVGVRRYFVTVCCAGRCPVFGDARAAQLVLSHLLSTAAAYRFRLHAWCVMPDHVHILAEGADDACDLVLFIRQFKLRASRQRCDAQGLSLWQRNFYDHVLRREEELLRVAAYIWSNPVRKGLCVDPKEFAFSGSQTFPWRQVVVPVKPWRPPWKAREAQRPVGHGLDPV